MRRRLLLLLVAIPLLLVLALPAAAVDLRREPATGRGTAARRSTKRGMPSRRQVAALRCQYRGAR